MTQRNKNLAFLFLLISIFILMLLASGLSRVEFQPGSITQQSASQTKLVSPLAVDLLKLDNALKVFLAVMFWVVLPISVIVFIRYPETRKRFFQGMIYVGIYGFALLIYINAGTQEEAPQEETSLEEVNLGLVETQREAAEFMGTAADPNPTFNIILDISIAVLILGSIAYIYWRFFRKKPSTTAQIRTDIESSIDDLRAGADLSNVIIRCYADMSQTLLQAHGIRRDKAMTPREFERELGSLGFPEGAAQQLTRLFEEVRYGDIQQDETAEARALQCLTDIAVACETL